MAARARLVSCLYRVQECSGAGMEAARCARGYIPMAGAGSFNQHLDPGFTHLARTGDLLLPGQCTARCTCTWHCSDLLNSSALFPKYKTRLKLVIRSLDETLNIQ